jgi:hypothetical protein
LITVCWAIWITRNGVIFLPWTCNHSHLEKKGSKMNLVSCVWRPSQASVMPSVLGEFFLAFSFFLAWV